MARNFTSISNHEIIVSAGVGATELDVDLANAMTVALWFKRNGVQESFASLLSKTVQNGLGSAPAIQYYLAVDGVTNSAYKIFFGRSDGVQLTAGPGAMSATDGKWNFVAATFFPGETIKFYYAEEFAALTQVAGTATSVGNVLFTDNTDDLTIGSFFQTGSNIRNFNGDICHIGLWNARLTLNEINSFRWGKIPQPAALKFWMPLSGDFSPEPDWSPNGNNGILTGTTKSNHAPIIPYSKKVWQSNVIEIPDPASTPASASITRSIPSGSRGTKLTLSSPNASATQTNWEFTPTLGGAGKKFTIITTSGGSSSASVLSSSLNSLDIWLPPFHKYNVRTRQKLPNGRFASWTSVQLIESRGPLNSFEKYLALSRLGGVDNV